MRRMFGLVFILFVSYLLIQIAYNYLSKGYEINYKIDGYEVFEKYVSRTKNEKDSYYIEVTDGTSVFSYNTYKNFNKKKEIVKNINIVESDGYKCIYIKFKDNYNSNIRCLKNNIAYNYQDIKGKSISLDNKVRELDYDINKYIDTAEEVKRYDGIFVSQANLIKGHFMGLTSFKGLYLINNYSDVKYLYDEQIFSKDKINQTIAIYMGKKYLVADYDQEYTFNKFYLVETTYADKTEIKYHSKISFDSYFMGAVGNKAYLLDCDNKKQYEIDINTKTVIEIGNEKLGIKYYKNGKWDKINAITAVNNKPKFIMSSEEKEGYVRVDLIGGNKTGYKYYYKKNGSTYDVYRSMQNKENLLYLFSTSYIDNIVYYNDYVYYQDGEYIKCYQDDIGNKKIYHSTKKVFSGTYLFGVSNE